MFHRCTASFKLPVSFGFDEGALCAAASGTSALGARGTAAFPLFPHSRLNAMQQRAVRRAGFQPVNIPALARRRVLFFPFVWILQALAGWKPAPRARFRFFRISVEKGAQPRFELSDFQRRVAVVAPDHAVNADVGPARIVLAPAGGYAAFA
jgi:hypothetical protein